MHQTVAEWYEQNQPDDLAPYYPILAYHWSETDATEKAMEYLDRAGEQALDNDANREAIQFLSRSALEADSSDSVQNTRMRLSKRQYGLAEAYYRLGQFSESEGHCRKALEFLERPVPTSDVKLIMSVLGLLGHQVGRRLPLPFLNGSRSQPGEAREETVLAYQAYLRFTWLSFLNSNTNLTVFGTLNCLKMAEALGPSAELAHAYAMISGASGLIPVHGLARFYQRKALDAVPNTEGEESVALAQVLPRISVYTSGVGQWEQTERYLSQALGLQELYGDWSEWGLCMQMIGRSAAHQGDYGRLSETSQLFMTSARRREALLEQAWCMQNQIESVLYTTNDVTEAIELGENALSLLENTNNPSSHAIVYSLMALAQARSGDMKSSLDNATRALNIIEGMQPTSFGLLIAYASTSSALLKCWLAEDAPRKGDLTDRVEAASGALKALARVFPIAEPRALLNQGRYLWHTGRQAKAEKLWARALDRAEELGMQYEVGAAHFEIGRHLPSDSPSAVSDRREHLTQSLDVFGKLGVFYDLREA